MGKSLTFQHQQFTCRLHCSLPSLRGEQRKLRQVMRGVMQALEDALWSTRKLGLKRLGSERLSWELTLCGDRCIRSLNRDYRQKDQVTDVLSFPVHEALRDSLDKGVESAFKEELHLGDLIICWPQTLRQSRKFEIDPWLELVHLQAHGFLHLLGFDHEISSQEAQTMQFWEDQIVASYFKYKK